jgi:hypothetical protein
VYQSLPTCVSLHVWLHLHSHGSEEASVPRVGSSLARSLVPASPEFKSI